MRSRVRFLRGFVSAHWWSVPNRTKQLSSAPASFRTSTLLIYDEFIIEISIAIFLLPSDLFTVLLKHVFQVSSEENSRKEFLVQPCLKYNETGIFQLALSLLLHILGYQWTYTFNFRKVRRTDGGIMGSLAPKNAMYLFIHDFGVRILSSLHFASKVSPGIFDKTFVIMENRHLDFFPKWFG